MRLSGDDPLDLRPRPAGTTVWRIVSSGELPDWVNVALTMASDDPVLIAMIERAASNAGILLERIEPDPG